MAWVVLPLQALEQKEEEGGMMCLGVVPTTQQML